MSFRKSGAERKESGEKDRLFAPPLAQKKRPRRRAKKMVDWKCRKGDGGASFPVEKAGSLTPQGKWNHWCRAKGEGDCESHQKEGVTKSRERQDWAPRKLGRYKT